MCGRFQRPLCHLNRSIYGDTLTLYPGAKVPRLVLVINYGFAEFHGIQGMQVLQIVSLSGI